MNRLMPNVAV